MSHVRRLARPPHRVVGPMLLAAVVAFGSGGVCAADDCVSRLLAGAMEDYGSSSSGREFFFEYRGTEVFDEPLTDVVMPESLVTIGTRVTTRRSRRFAVETELYRYGEGTPDRFKTLVRYSKPRSATSWIGGGFTYYQAQVPTDPLLVTEREQYWGASVFAEAVGRLGANVDALGQIQAIRGADDALGGRIEGLLDIALSPNTRARVRGWAFKDDGSSESNMGEVMLARGFGRRTAFHAAYRAFRSRSDTGASDSAVQTVEFRREMTRARLLFRLGYRWYQGSDDVTAEGPSAGFEYAQGERTFGVFFRHYESSDELAAGSAWFTFSTKF